MSIFYHVEKNEYGSHRLKWANIVALSVVSAVVLIVVMMFGIPAYNRSQRLKNENNLTQVNDIAIAQTAQLVKVQQQKAQIQIEQARGIAEAQKIIANSLTNQYLQYEAIEAQKAEINGNNHTVIYIPSGANGIPFVQNLNPNN